MKRNSSVLCGVLVAYKTGRKCSRPMVCISSIWGTDTPGPIATKFCMPGAVQDVITPANFCEDGLRGFGVARGRI